MTDDKQKTTVPLLKPTRNRVKDYGKKGESWDDLFNRIMDTINRLENDNIQLKKEMELIKHGRT